MGEDRLRRLGLGRSGPAVPHHDQRLAHLRRPAAPIRASNPCSEYMFLDDTACNLASINLLPFRNADGTFDIAAYEHAVRLWTIVLEISVMMAQFPSKEIAELSYEYRTLGLGYANIGGLLMTSGIPYDSRRGPRHLRRAHRDHDRHRLRHLGRDGRRARRLPGLRPQREHMLRVMRNHRRAAYGDRRRLREAARSTRCRSTTPTCTQAGTGRARPRRLGPRHRARRGARLPQRPGDRDRADRHDRPRHGLRHHRHRARLRAGEVQEARRRRLLQDHQPRRARGAAHARLFRGADRRDRGLCGRPRQPQPGARRSTPTRSKAKGFTDEKIAAVERGARSRPSTSNSSSTSGRSAPTGEGRRSASPTSSSPTSPSTCCRRSASPGRTSRPPTSMSAAR